jgi:hypothetical protein
MEWVVKLETKNGWGEVETIEVSRLARRPTGLAAEEFGLILAEGKNLVGDLVGSSFRRRWRNLSPALVFAATA